MNGASLFSGGFNKTAGDARYIQKSPGAAGNTIQPTADVVPLTIKGESGQTADLLDVTDSSGNSLFKLDVGGRITSTVTRTPSADKPVHFLVTAANRTASGFDTAVGTEINYKGSTDAFNYTEDIALNVLAQFRGTKAAGTGNQATTVNGMTFQAQDFDNDTFAVSTGDVGTILGCYGAAAKVGTGTTGTVVGVHANIQSFNVGGSPGNVTDFFGFRAYMDLEPDPGKVYTNATFFGIEAPFWGSAGGHITNVYGLHVLNLGNAITTNAYGVYIDAQSGATNNYAIYSAGGASVLLAGAAGVTPLTLQAAATPTADILKFQDSTPTVIGRIDKNGTIITKRNAAPADADLATNELALWFDPTAGAAKLMVKAKNASGTVVTGSLALA